MNNRRITLKTSWVQEECAPKAESGRPAGNGIKCPSCGCPLRITADGKASCWFCEKEFNVDPSMMVQKESKQVDNEPKWGRSIHELGKDEKEGIVHPTGAKVDLDEEEEELGFEIEYEEEEEELEEEEEEVTGEDDGGMEIEFEEEEEEEEADAPPPGKGARKETAASVKEEEELEFEMEGGSEEEGGEEDEEEEEWEPQGSGAGQKKMKRFISEADVVFDP